MFYDLLSFARYKYKTLYCERVAHPPHDGRGWDEPRSIFIAIKIERVWGVEPHSLAWKAKVIPIYDTRVRNF